jgi:hypothetical protein
MLVHGEGGTGKSFVINTMVGLLDHVKLKHWVSVCAPTGKAAVNIGGDTIDGLFGLSRKGNTTGYGNTANTSESSIHESSPPNDALYLIVDEISMVGKERLGEMHDKLSQNIGEENSNHILGNKSFIFFGDFLQFPPVGKTCIISKATFAESSNHVAPETRKCRLGTIIFKSIEYFIELTEQKRQDDLDLLRAMRNQNVTQHHVDYLNRNCQFQDFNSYPLPWLVETSAQIKKSLIGTSA